jgi:hypothetical protein
MRCVEDSLDCPLSLDEIPWVKHGWLHITANELISVNRLRLLQFADKWLYGPWVLHPARLVQRARGRSSTGGKHGVISAMARLARLGLVLKGHAPTISVRSELQKPFSHTGRRPCELQVGTLDVQLSYGANH